MLDQNQTPLLDALKIYIQHPHAPFYTPGHKQGKGISPKLIEVFGHTIFGADLSELTELDNLFAPQGVIDLAQNLAAEAFGANHTRFLVNGSTCGIEAGILATCGEGDKIILPRNIHSSAISGLIISGAIPIFINPEYDPISDIAHSITPRTLEAALRKHPDVKAVMIVYPTYYGVCGDISAIAQLTHDYNIPLLVDEAHGAHFAFHPDLPIPALAAGADLSVQSIHKTLGALTQASMLHVQGERIDIERVNKALQLVQSTSPSYLLLASLDAARQQMALYGKELLSNTLKLSEEAVNHISQIPNLLVPLFVSGKLGVTSVDKTRLTVNVSALGITGFQADEILEEKLNVYSELASVQNITFIISLGNTKQDIESLVKGFISLSKNYQNTESLLPNLRQSSINVFNRLQSQVEYHQAISPRQAFFASTQTLPIKETPGKVSAETICPYPPGIPVLIAGEVINQDILECLQEVKSQGGFITGCTDCTLNYLNIVYV
ncbi:MAG: aminotransferase class I/II-fold pyridoxal phosphate-dependent enzyme [Cyanobacteria bacterium P01_A01_bin.84]